MSAGPATAENNPAVAIAFIVVGMVSISLNDMLMKLLSGDYPLHEMVFVRSAIGIGFSLVLVQFEGGLVILRTRTPLLHVLRGALVVLSNSLYFAALAVMSLADANALFFVAPLFITILSIPLLGEKVGVRRMTAVVVGFLGVLIMLRPGSDIAAGVENRVVLFLPVIAALAYSLMQMLTRRLGLTAKASAMAIYIQGTFVLVSALFWLVAGDGRYAEGVEDPSLLFLLRAWTWPAPGDEWLFAALGANSAAIGYCLSRAYKSADAATVAPFEYVALPLAILWGWVFWSTVPGPETMAGIALIVASGLYVFVRERTKRRVPAPRSMRRW